VWARHKTCVRGGGAVGTGSGVRVCMCMPVGPEQMIRSTEVFHRHEAHTHIHTHTHIGHTHTGHTLTGHTHTYNHTRTHTIRTSHTHTHRSSFTFTQATHTRRRGTPRSGAVGRAPPTRAMRASRGSGAAVADSNNRRAAFTCARPMAASALGCPGDGPKMIDEYLVREGQGSRRAKHTSYDVG
jgi:hypothetical protein